MASDFLYELIERHTVAEDRLTTIHSTYQAARAKLDAEFQRDQAEVQGEKDALQTLIEVERRRLGEPDERLPLAVPTMELGEFFLTRLQVESPQSKDDLRAAAERAGFFPDGDGGRKTHATLMNYARSGRIRTLPNNMYAYPTLTMALLRPSVLGSFALRAEIAPAAGSGSDLDVLCPLSDAPDV